MPISRRDFLKKSATATAAASLASSPIIALTPKEVKFDPSPLNKWPGRVILNYNNTHEATPTGGNSDDETIIKKMVDDAIKLLTSQPTVGEAWKSIFPDSLSQSSKIAIKINILNPTIVPHPFVVMGITEGLMQMDIGGSNFPAENIFIYDYNNGSSFNTAGFTSSRFPDISVTKSPLSDHGDGAYNNTDYSNTLYDCDFLINTFSPRGHSSHSGRFTLGFKSHYGTYPAMYHDNSSTPPYQRDINCTGPVYNKSVLSVMGGIFGLKEGTGPGGDWNSTVYYTEWVNIMDSTSDDPRPNTVILSTDPVSAEFMAIKMMKIRDGNSYDVSDMPDYLKASGGIQGALDPTYNIGVIRESEMEYGEIINEDVTVDPVPVSIKKKYSVNRNKARIILFHTPYKHSVFIDLEIPIGYTGKVAEVFIVNTKGRIVRQLSQKILGIRNRAVWDGRDAVGRRVATGKYIVKAKIGNLNLVNSISLIN